MTNLKILYDRVMVFRAYMDANTDWKTPSVIDCLRFAVCEAAESLDAWLREKGGYARNRENGHTVHSELAQCAMMLFTALGSDCKSPRFYLPSTVNNSIDNIIIWTVAALADYLDSLPTWDVGSIEALVSINSYPGMDLSAELDLCMERLRWKHDASHCTQRLPAAEAAWDSGHTAHDIPVPPGAYPHIVTFDTGGGKTQAAIWNDEQAQRWAGSGMEESD